MKKAIRREWYGVKLLYKSVITGAPEQDTVDEFFYDAHEFFEESVILVKAASFDEAYRLAEQSARGNGYTYKNKYGQSVTFTFYKSIDCFHLFDSPKTMTEVYSSFFINSNNEDEQDFLKNRYACCTGKDMHLLHQS